MSWVRAATLAHMILSQSLTDDVIDELGERYPTEASTLRAVLAA